MPRHRWARINVGKRRTLKKRVRRQLHAYRKEHKRDLGLHDRWTWEANLHARMLEHLEQGQ
jgi:hypothetical protein